MKLLFLAPQPFYEERGTPIAVRLALTVLAERFKDDRVNSIDLLTYHLGAEVTIPGVVVHRIPKIPFIKRVPPGISLAKLVCDAVFFIKFIQLLIHARKSQYNLIHAVEESAFFALISRVFFGIPFIYDMDSSLSMQLTEKWWILRPFRPIFEMLEGAVIKRSLSVVPVCDALAEIAKSHGKLSPIILSDISLLEETNDREDLRATLQISSSSILCLYSGNLERYQGIDLLIESFQKVIAEGIDAALVIIGGSKDDCAKYQARCRSLGLDTHVFVIGPRPVHQLYGYLMQADILVSPRTLGNNTPMKIYSYLHSGKPLVATRLKTHTQVLNDSVALLAEPDSSHYSAGIIQLAQNQPLRESLGQAALKLAEERYTFPAFKNCLNRIYDSLLVS